MQTISHKETCALSQFYDTTETLEWLTADCCYHGTSPSYIQSCFTRVRDMKSRRRLRSSTSHRLDVPPVRLYSRQAGVSGFWCHRLERPASPRRICAVTRGFQTTIQDVSVFPFLPRHYHMTRVLLLPFVTTVWTPVVLTIINII